MMNVIEAQDRAAWWQRRARALLRQVRKERKWRRNWTRICNLGAEQGARTTAKYRAALATTDDLRARLAAVSAENARLRQLALDAAWAYQHHGSNPDGCYAACRALAEAIG